MYRYSAPIYNTHITADTRAQYLEGFRKARIERVFLIAKYDFETGEIFHFDLLCENIAWLRENGISPAIWAGETIGHGGLVHDANARKKATVTPLRNFDGEDLGGTRCPADARFCAALKKIFAGLAASHPDYILIDDDFRISYHGKVHACVCDLHLAELSRRFGEPVTREQVRDAVMHGGQNPLRDIYLQTMGDTLRDLARGLRAVVDAVDESVGLSLCTCHNHWDLDDADPVEMTRILCGKRAPLLRLHGAPYWAAFTADKDLPFVFEHARMFAALSVGNGFELMNELDAYPRPRQNCPATYVELVDAVMRADATTHGALKYMYDYVSTLGYEKGYLALHTRDLPALDAIERLFAKGAQTGVKICTFPHRIAQNDSDLTPPHPQMPRPVAGIAVSRCTLPTTYVGAGVCCAVFGQDVDAIKTEELGDALILDGVSALLLHERGVDVGLVPDRPLRESLLSLSPNRLHSADGAESALLLKAQGSYLATTLSPRAEVQLYVQEKDTRVPLCYRYENENGQRFLVWTYHSATLKRDADVTSAYLTADAMRTGTEWISRRPLPAQCVGNPLLYMMCRKDGDTLSVGLFNAFSDPVLSPEIKLGAAYREVTGAINTSAVIAGDTVTLAELAPFGFCAFSVK